LQPGFSSPIQSLRSRQGLQEEVYRDDDVSEDEGEEEEEEERAVSSTLKRIVPLHRRGLGAQLVQRMTGSMRYAGERALECPVAGKDTNCITSTENQH
jgi:hypothetical protein